MFSPSKMEAPPPTTYPLSARCPRPELRASWCGERRRVGVVPTRPVGDAGGGRCGRSATRNAARPLGGIPRRPRRRPPSGAAPPRPPARRRSLVGGGREAAAVAARRLLFRPGEEAPHPWPHVRSARPERQPSGIVARARGRTQRSRAGRSDQNSASGSEAAMPARNFPGGMRRLAV